MKLKSIEQIQGAKPGVAWGVTDTDRKIEVYPVFDKGNTDDSYLYNPGASFVEVTADNWSSVRVCVRTEALNLDVKNNDIMPLSSGFGLTISSAIV